MPATSNKLKIGLVLDDGLDSLDGVQQYILGIGEWFKQQGHEVRYIVGETKRTDIDDVISISKNIKVRFNGNVGTMPLPASKTKLKKILDTEKFDVLHVQMPYSPFMSKKLIELTPKKTVVVGTFHIAPNSKLVHVANRLLGLWLHKSLRRFDKLLSVSSAAQQFALSTFKIQTAISPNVVDYDLFHNAKQLQQYSNNDTKYILFLGRLVPRKGCMVLLGAINILRNDSKIPNYKVIICGKGFLESKLKDYVAANHLSNIVEFVGFVTEADKPRYYASADISVFPSSGGESFGIVLIEAMASGKSAILAGDNEGYRSVLEDKSDMLFEPLDAEALADKIKVLLKDEEYRIKNAERGSKYVKDFDINKVGHQLITLYQNTLINKAK